MATNVDVRPPKARPVGLPHFLWELADRMVAEVERAALSIERRMWGGDTGLEGIVRVATSEAFSGFLVKRLPALRVQHPQIQVEIVSGNVAVDLVRGEADVAVRMMRPTQPELVARKLGDVGWSMYAAEVYLTARGEPWQSTAVSVPRRSRRRGGSAPSQRRCSVDVWATVYA